MSVLGSSSETGTFSKCVSAECVSKMQPFPFGKHLEPCPLWIFRVSVPFKGHTFTNTVVIVP